MKLSRITLILSNYIIHDEELSIHTTERKIDEKGLKNSKFVLVFPLIPRCIVLFFEIFMSEQFLKICV